MGVRVRVRVRIRVRVRVRVRARARVRVRNWVRVRPAVRAGGQREHCRAAAVPRGGPHRAVVQRRLEPVLPARRGRTQRGVSRACEPQPPAEDFGRASERQQGRRVLARYLEVGSGAHGLARFRGLEWG